MSSPTHDAHAWPAAGRTVDVTDQPGDVLVAPRRATRLPRLARLEAEVEARREAERRRRAGLAARPVSPLVAHARQATSAPSTADSVSLPAVPGVTLVGPVGSARDEAGHTIAGATVTDETAPLRIGEIGSRVATPPSTTGRSRLATAAEEAAARELERIERAAAIAAALRAPSPRRGPRTATSAPTSAPEPTTPRRDASPLVDRGPETILAEVLADVPTSRATPPGHQTLPDGRPRLVPSTVTPRTAGAPIAATRSRALVDAPLDAEDLLAGRADLADAETGFGAPLAADGHDPEALAALAAAAAAARAGSPPAPADRPATDDSATDHGAAERPSTTAAASPAVDPRRQHAEAVLGGQILVVEAATVHKALHDIAARLGSGVDILDLERVRRGGVAGFFTREVVRIRVRVPDGGVEGEFRVSPPTSDRDTGPETTHPAIVPAPTRALARRLEDLRPGESGIEAMLAAMADDAERHEAGFGAALAAQLGDDVPATAARQAA